MSFMSVACCQAEASASANHSSGAVLQSVACVSVIASKGNTMTRRRAKAPQEKREILFLYRSASYRN